MNLCLVSDNEGLDAARRWGQFLKAPLNPADPGTFSYHLFFQQGELVLRDPQGRKLAIDFDKNHLDYQRKHRGKSELMAKALGASKGVKSILDLSVGLGIDSVFLTQLGFQVTGVERSPLLYVLLSEAFSRTQLPSLKNYRLHFGEAADFLRTQRDHLKVDAIYFDPMYPHKKKSALPKQEMLIFRELVGDDTDAAAVLAAALEWDCDRVAVKRPVHAEALRPEVQRPEVQHSYEGKTVRYDIYKKRKL